MFCKLPLVVFRYGNLPRGFPTPGLPLASRFTVHVSMETKTGWVKREGGKSSSNRWRFPVWKVGFSQAGLLLFQDFFPRKQKEGHALMWRWMGGSGLPLLPAAFRPAAPALRFNAVIYGHSAATEVLTWLKASVF